MIQNKDILLQVKNVKQYFNEGKPSEVRAIENISFDIYKGETF
ncbi:peptide ABC transporter ATP-binding protein, partial [Mesorhizobium sp. M8A.F.Ca.ET.173.01.1.1]